MKNYDFNVNQNPDSDFPIVEHNGTFVLMFSELPWNCLIYNFSIFMEHFSLFLCLVSGGILKGPCKVFSHARVTSLSRLVSEVVFRHWNCLHMRVDKCRFQHWQEQETTGSSPDICQWINALAVCDGLMSDVKRWDLWALFYRLEPQPEGVVAFILQVSIWWQMWFWPHKGDIGLVCSVTPSSCHHFHVHVVICPSSL